LRTRATYEREIHRQPRALAGIVADTEVLSFGMISEAKVGSLLAALAESFAEVGLVSVFAIDRRCN
jgi:hypothetical protein